MGIVYIASGEEDFRIGVSEAADLVGIFDARVGYQYLAAHRIGRPAGDRQHCAGRCQGDRQRRQKEDV